MEEAFDIEALEVKWILGMIHTHELPTVAVELMTHGFDSESLLQLAVGDATRVVESGSLFQQALEELGRGKISKLDALKHYAKTVSRRILNAEVSPLEGARAIWHAQLSVGLSDFPGLDPFIYAASELEDRPEDSELFERMIRDEAGRWASR